MYTPRLKAPSKSNAKYYKSNPFYKAGYGLPNCFDGNTKFITDKGIKTLKECENTSIKVLTEQGDFKEATVKCFGEQEVFKMVLNNGSEYIVTGNHRWIVDKFSQYKTKEGVLYKYEKRIEKNTVDLTPNDNIPYQMYCGNKQTDEEGIRHGFIYGDGSLYNERKYSRAALCGLKKTYMMPYFENAKHSCTNSNGVIECYPYPKEYKELPSLDCSEEYLRGFIVGYLAADGTVSKNGTVEISSSKYDDLLYVKDICALIGIRTSNVKTTLRCGFNEFESELHRICLLRSTLTSDMFLNPTHRHYFESNEIKSITHTRIKELIPLHENRLVYCVVEPETHTFTLADNVLTGNCTAYCFGRRWELEGKKPTLSTGNAEDWYGKKDGYKRGQLPRLGAVICWRKGKVNKGSDGAGHVAVVEKLYSDGSILVSMSGWKASKTFWTQRLYPPFSYGSGYTLQGFIYCPTVKDTDCTTKFKVGSYRGHGISTNGSWDPGTTYKGDTEAKLVAPIVTAQNKYLKATGRFKIYTDPNNNINMIKQIAKSNKNDVAVHIADHCDYPGAPSGSNPLHNKNSKYGKELAKHANKYVKQYTGLKSKGLTARTDLGELNDTNMPAVVFELGSIKYDADVFKEKYDEYGKAIARGICEYFGVPFTLKDNVKSQTYKKGETYKLESDMKVRTGAGTGYRQKKRTELTASGKKSAKDGKYAVLKKGTKVTCQKVVKKSNGEVWIKIPSGYICAKNKKKVYVT